MSDHPLLDDAPRERGDATRSGDSRRRARERRRRTRRLRAAGVILAVLAALGLVVAWAWPTVSDTVSGILGTGAPDYADEDATGGTADVVIPPGANGGEIAELLFQADVVASSRAFVDVATGRPEAARIQPGTYELPTRIPATAALTALLDPANRLVVSITIPEGFTRTQVVERVAAALGTDAATVEAAANDPAALGLPAEAGGNVEGWLAPATYQFEPDDTPTTVLARMITQQVGRLDARGIAPDQRQAVLIKASIVEREVAIDEYFGKVARVMENRLSGGTETYGYLQMDSTVLYGVGKSGGIPSQADLQADNPYNTYVHPGLPPTPIGSPGELAIDSVLSPEEGPWLYFTTVNLDTGETKFATTLAEQQSLIEELRAWRDANAE